MKKPTTKKLFFYLKALRKGLVPQKILHSEYRRIMSAWDTYDADYLKFRLEYYHPVRTPFIPTPEARCHKNFDRTGINSSYFYDFKEYLRYFDASLRFDYCFGDNTINPAYPAFVKSRPILESGQNAILFKLNKLRHFYFVEDEVPFQDKLPVAVFRGACKRPHRRKFVEQCQGLPATDIGDTRPEHRNLPGARPFMSVADQLKHRFIISVEGNDVATNLKWIMSSNSLCFMCRPKFETWFMEGILEPDVHYVALKDDYSDLTEKIDYFSSHTDHALEIIRRANLYVEQFKDQALENLLLLAVMRRYFTLSGQL